MRSYERKLGFCCRAVHLSLFHEMLKPWTFFVLFMYIHNYNVCCFLLSSTNPQKKRITHLLLLPSEYYVSGICMLVCIGSTKMLINHAAFCNCIIWICTHTVQVKTLRQSSHRTLYSGNSAQYLCDLRTELKDTIHFLRTAEGRSVDF